MTDVKAASAASFDDSIGINTDLGAGDSSSELNLTAVESALSYLGLKLVRGAPYDTNIAAYKQLNRDLGIKFDFVVNGTSTAYFDKSLQLIEANPGIIAYVEGQNESDEPGETTNYDGLTGLPALTAEMQVLYAAVHGGDAKLAGIGVIQGSFGLPPTFAAYGDHAGDADYANSHIYYNYYPWGSDPLTAGGKEMLKYLANAQIVTPGAPNIVTETGYETEVGSRYVVSLADQAKYLLEAVFDLWNKGVVKTFIYNLYDSGPGVPGASATGLHYGLFNADWTPKPAAIALHNLMTLLADTGTGGVAPGSLDYTLTGAPSSVQTTLLEKSDGTFVLAIWQDVQLQNSAGVDTPVAAVPVTLKLASAYKSITVYDPLTGTSVQESFANAQTVQIMVPDHPILIEIGNASAPGVAAADQPFINAPPRLLAAADSIAQVPGLSIGNDTTGNITVRVTDSLGTLTMRDANNQALAGSGTDSITLYGPESIVNAELATLAYAYPVAGGADTISVQVTGNTGAVATDFIPVDRISYPAVQQSIGPVLSTPIGTAGPLTLTVATGGVFAVPGVVLSDDYYALHAGTMSMTITAASGKIDIFNYQFAHRINITGSYAELAAALKTLVYQAGGATGSDTIAVTVTDPSKLKSTASLPVAITGDVAIQNDSAITLNAGGSGNLGLSVNDVQAPGNAESLTVTVADVTGTLTMLNGEGNPQTGSGTHSISVSGTPDWVNGELASLLEHASSTGAADTVTIRARTSQGVLTTATTQVSVVAAKAAVPNADAVAAAPVATSAVTINAAPDAVIALGNDNETAIINAAPATSAGAANLVITEGDGSGALTVNGDAGDVSNTGAITSASVSAGSGSVTMSFVNARATITAGSGDLTIHGSAYGTNVTAGAGATDIWGGSGANSFTFHDGDGMMTIEDYTAKDSVTLDTALKAGMTEQSVSGGFELLFANDPHGGIVLKGATAGVISHINWG